MLAIFVSSSESNSDNISFVNITPNYTFTSINTSKEPLHESPINYTSSQKSKEMANDSKIVQKSKNKTSKLGLEISKDKNLEFLNKTIFFEYGGFRPKMRKNKNLKDYFRFLDLQENLIYVILQFETEDGIPTKKQLLTLKNDKFKLIGQYPGFTYVAKVPKEILETKTYNFIKWIDIPNKETKISKELRNSLDLDKALLVKVEFYENYTDGELIRINRYAKFVNKDDWEPEEHKIVVLIAPKEKEEQPYLVEEIASLNFVKSLQFIAKTDKRRLNLFVDQSEFVTNKSLYQNSHSVCPWKQKRLSAGELFSENLPQKKELSISATNDAINNNKDLKELYSHIEKSGYDSIKKAGKLTFENDGELFIIPIYSEKDKETVFIVKYEFLLPKSNSETPLVSKAFLAKLKTVNESLVWELSDKEGNIKKHIYTNGIIELNATHGSCGFWQCFSYGLEAVKNDPNYQEACRGICFLCEFSALPPDPIWEEIAIVCGACLSCTLGLGGEIAVGIDCAVDSCSWYPCQQDCNDNDGSGEWQNFCYQEDVWKRRWYYDYECDSEQPQQGQCRIADSGWTDETFLESCSYGCSNGYCQSEIQCYNDNDCPADGWAGSPSCHGDDVYQHYRDHRCENPGTTSSYCTYSDDYIMKRDCSFGCNNGQCEGGGNCASDEIDEDCSIGEEERVALLIGQGRAVSVNHNTDILICGDDYCTERGFAAKFDIDDCDGYLDETMLDDIKEVELVWWNDYGENDCSDTDLYYYLKDEDHLNNPDNHEDTLTNEVWWGDVSEGAGNCHANLNILDITGHFTNHLREDDDREIAYAWWPENDQDGWFMEDAGDPKLEVEYCKECPDNDNDDYHEQGSDCGTDDDCDDYNRHINPGANSYCDCDDADGYDQGAEETCDNIDNDCDGNVDESLYRGCGLGICSGGVEHCFDGDWGSCSTDYLATDETCNNLDDDCDGNVDESLSQECGTDTGECVKGTQTCSSGVWGGCGGTYVGPSEETCNDKDDNCNDIIDEGNVCNTTISLNIEFPENNTEFTVGASPDFGFNITSVNFTTFNCSLWIDDGVEEATYDNLPYVNWNTSYNLTANSTLSDDTYLWWINCTDGVNYGASEKRTMIINALDGESPAVSGVSAIPNSQGFGEDIIINAKITDENIITAWVGITTPENSQINYTLINTIENNYTLSNFTDFSNGTYSYKIYANDSFGNLNDSESGTFDMYINFLTQIKTLKDSYGNNEYVNLTDPPDDDSQNFEKIDETENSETYITPSGGFTTLFYSSAINIRDDNNVLKPYSNVTKLELKNQDNPYLELSWKNKVIKLEPYLIINSQKIKDIPIEYNLNTIINESRDYYKWSYVLNNNVYLEKVGFDIITNLPTSIEENALIVDEQRIGFDDLIESGFNVDISQQSVEISNFEGNELLLDPTITFNDTTGVKDTYIEKDHPKAVRGSSTLIRIEDGIESSSDDNNLALIWFNVSEIPVGSIIGNASLSIYVSSEACEDDDMVSISKILHFWNEGTGSAIPNSESRNGTSWYERWYGDNANDGNGPNFNENDEDWETPGLGEDKDYDNDILDSYDCNTGSDLWNSFDVTPAIQDYIDGESNYGFLIYMPYSNNFDKVIFRSSEYSNPDYRPYLKVDYHPGDSKTTPEEEQSKIVNNDDSLNASIYLLMKVQFYDSGDWIDEAVIINDAVPRRVNSTKTQALDIIWNPISWNTVDKTHDYGTYRAYVALTDENDVTLQNTGGTNAIATYNFTISDIQDNPPSVSLISPLDNSIDTDGDVDFSCSASDEYNLTNIRLYHNITGDWLLNETKDISGTFATETFTINNILDGTNFSWNCLAFDGSDQGAFADANYSISIDLSNTEPALESKYPESATVNIEEPQGQIFSVNYTDNEGDSSIAWYLDNEQVSSQYTGFSFYTKDTQDFPLGITENGTEIFIVDSTGEKVYYYSLTLNGTFYPNFKDSFNITSNNDSRGITFNGTYFWITDSNQSVYKYFDNGSYANEFFNYTTTNNDSYGITDNNTYFWVVDNSGAEVYRYYINGSYVDSFDTSSSGNTDPIGITNNNDNLWITDRSQGRVYRYDMDGSYIDFFETLMENNEPLGIELIEDDLWVVDGNSKVYQYYINNTSIYYFEGNYTTDGSHNVTIIINDSQFSDSFEWTLIVNDTRTTNFINSCGILNKPSTIYYLDNNVSSNGTCIELQANNITLDGKGYTIDYGQYEQGHGIYNYGYNDTTIINVSIVLNNLTSKNSPGIKFENNSNNKIINNTLNIKGFPLTDSNNHGLYFKDVSDTIIENNNITTLNQEGSAIYLYATLDEECSNNIIENNIINTGKSESHGISFWGLNGGIVEYNFVSHNTISTESGNSKGIYLQQDSGYNILADNIITTSWSESPGIEIYISSNNLIKDSNISATFASVNDVELAGSVNNNTFLNVTYDTEGVGASAELIRKWYFNAQVNDTNGNPLEQVNVTGKNITNSIQFSELTNTNGDIEQQEVIEYINDGGTKSYYTDYTIRSKKGGFATDLQIINITTNQNLQITLLPASNLIFNLSEIYQNVPDTLRIFRFTINNTVNSTDNFTWQFDTDESIISNDINFTLQSNETIFNFIEYNFTNLGEHEIEAIVRSGAYADSEIINVTI